jgi:hypothetical protein
MLSTPTDLALDQWLSSKINLAEHFANLRAAKYNEVADLLDASEEELAALIAEVGMEPPEERRLRAGISREEKKQKLAKKNATMLQELQNRIRVRQLLAGSVIVIFDILPPPSVDSKDQVIDDDELFGGDHDLIGVGTDIIVECFEQFFEPQNNLPGEEKNDAKTPAAETAGRTIEAQVPVGKYLSKMHHLSRTEWRKGETGSDDAVETDLEPDSEQLLVSSEPTGIPLELYDEDAALAKADEEAEAEAQAWTVRVRAVMANLRALDALESELLAALGDESEAQLEPELEHFEQMDGQIFVKTPLAGTYTLQVKGTDLVRSVKVQLEGMDGLPIEQQRLWYACAGKGKWLEDQKMLADYRICEGSELAMI